VADYRYGYDGAGNRTYMQRAHLLDQPADMYEYDPLYRPTQVYYGANDTDPGAISSYVSQQSFDIDLLANRLEMDDDGDLVDYGPDDGRQLSNPMNRYEVVDGIALTYDLRGNTLTDGIYTYTYDILNRQVGLDWPGGDAEYVFNALGNRVAKSVGGAVTYYLYDNQGQVLEERDGANLLDARFTYGPDIDLPVTMERGGSTTYYHRDAQNSISELTDAAGDLVEAYRYDIYGRVTIMAPDGTILASSAVGNPYLYTGRRFDPESGNYHFRGRTYSPELGRFLQMDPLGYVDGMNLYASYFVINGIDPYGTFSLLDLLNAFNSGIPEINVEAGISIEVRSPPLIGPLGIMVKMETKFIFGTCCDKGKIKNYAQVNVTAVAGVHFATPGYFPSAAIKTTVGRNNCPKVGPFDCQGIISVNFSGAIISAGCTMKWDGSWSCSLTGKGIGGSYGSSGLSGQAGASTPPSITNVGVSISGGVECTKASVW